MSPFNGDPFAEMRPPVMPVVEPEEAAAQRRRVIARMENLQDAALRRRTTARTTRRWLLRGLAAVAAVAAIAVAFTWSIQERGAAPAASLDRAAPIAGTMLKLRSGAVLELASTTELYVAREEPAFEEVSLQRGGVEVRVPKLSPGAQLVVRTPDTAVTVRGTRFSVKFGPGRANTPCTTVRVTEGRVEVDHGGRVSALTTGDSWSSEDQPAFAASAPPPAATATAPRPGTLTVAPPKRLHAPAALDHNQPSTLAEENALLERAMAASRSGNSERAVSLLDEHLHKYPRSPVSRNAELERLRALDRAGAPGSARAAARRYLSKYPDGMGADEARRIATRPHTVESTPRSSP